MKIQTLYLVCLLVLMACGSKSEKKSSLNDAIPASTLNHTTIKKIDIHAHYQKNRDYLPSLFQKWNMQSVLVDVAKADSTRVTRAWKSYLNHANSSPDLFFLCTSLIGVGIDDSNFAENAITQLTQEINAGACMVKVWKNFGMVTKDANGNFIQIDDPRLQPIWDFLKDKNIPVMAHIGEPEQAWRPLNDPDNPHYGYYKNNPQYHAYNHPEIPSYETIMSARDNWIENNPELTILCAHLGSMSHNVSMVSERLDKFPNMHVEMGARFGDLAKQDTKLVREFFNKYQNRILFGSDYGNSKVQESMSADELKNEEASLDENYTHLWNYLSGTDSLIIRKQHTLGLGLSTTVLEKIYAQNAVNLLDLE